MTLPITLFPAATEDWRPATGARRLETEDRRLKTGDRRLATSDWSPLR